MMFSDMARRAAKFAIDNSPTILTTFGVVGAVTTAYLAGKASFEAAGIIHLKEADDESRGQLAHDPKEILKDRVELVWRLYIPAVTTGIATVVCIIGANRIGSRRAASLAAAYKISERAYEEYKSKVVQKFGERKEEGVRADIIQDRINDSWDDDSIVIYGKPTGSVFYDKYSDRYVWTTAEDLRSAINDFNQSILHNGYATAADLYDLLDMPAPKWAHEVGWNSDRKLMQVQFSSALTPGDKPVNAFEFDVEPVRNYANFH